MKRYSCHAVSMSRATHSEDPYGMWVRWEDVEAKIAALKAENKRLRGSFVKWLLTRIAEGDHGCLTGDCPHHDTSECVAKLLNDWNETVKEKP